ncbi:MAG: hypothetical protein FJX74_16280 [Armatimonadetes bacterium]|nr:hypothetical protein [Armatimonadota bacterium]
MTMLDWSAELSGDTKVLKHAEKLFQFPWCRITGGDGRYFLRSNAFKGDDAADAVRDKAAALVSFTNACVRLAAGPVPPIGIAQVICESAGGGRAVSDMRACLCVPRPQPTCPEDDQHLMLPFQDAGRLEQLYRRTGASSSIDLIMQIWSSRPLDYRDLWVVWDLIRQHVVDEWGRDKESVRSFITEDQQWATDEEIRRFQCTANSIQKAGLDSRHGSFADPPAECLQSFTRMDAAEARCLIERILKRMLIEDLEGSGAQ